MVPSNTMSTHVLAAFWLVVVWCMAFAVLTPSSERGFVMCMACFTETLSLLYVLDVSFRGPEPGVEEVQFSADSQEGPRRTGLSRHRSLHSKGPAQGQQQQPYRRKPIQAGRTVPGHKPDNKCSNQSRCASCLAHNTAAAASGTRRTDGMGSRPRVLRPGKAQRCRQESRDARCHLQAQSS